MNTLHTLKTAVWVLFFASAFTGCGGIEKRSHKAYAPMEPIVYTHPKEGESAGSLYNEQRGMSLFADTRARSVGDIISIVLTESTQASKNAGTAIGRDAGLEVSQPTLFGRSNPDFSVDKFRGLTLEQNIESSSEFTGNGSSNQSNSPLQFRLRGFYPTAISLSKVRSGLRLIRARSSFNSAALFVPKTLAPPIASPRRSLLMPVFHTEALE